MLMGWGGVVKNQMTYLGLMEVEAERRETQAARELGRRLCFLVGAIPCQIPCLKNYKTDETPTALGVRLVVFSGVFQYAGWGTQGHFEDAGNTVFFIQVLVTYPVFIL